MTWKESPVGRAAVAEFRAGALWEVMRLYIPDLPPAERVLLDREPVMVEHNIDNAGIMHATIRLVLMP